MTSEWKLYIKDGKLIFPNKESLVRFARTQPDGNLYMRLADKPLYDGINPLYRNTMFGDMGMLSKAMDGNYSPRKIYTVTMHMFPEYFQKENVDHGETYEYWVDIKDDSITNEIMIDWISGYRERWEFAFFGKIVDGQQINPELLKIGRASCRERV